MLFPHAKYRGVAWEDAIQWYSKKVNLVKYGLSTTPESCGNVKQIEN